MKRSSPTKGDLTGKRFGRLVILGRAEKRGSRGARTVPLWECRCDCGNITYKATDTLTNSDLSMCNDCAQKYATSKMHENAGFIGGTQITKFKSDNYDSNNMSGVRGVYYDRRTGKYRARLKFKGKLMNFGSYYTIEEALEARKKAENVCLGELLDSLNN